MSDCEASYHRALSTLVSQVDAKITVHKDPTRPYVGLENIPSGGAHLTGWSLASSSISTNSIFQAGDVLFGKLRPNLRKCVVAPIDGYCSTDILVLRANPGVDPSFAGKVLRTEQVGAAAEMTSVGTKMPRTSWKHLSELEVFCPVFPEQSKIAKVLDTLDTAIHDTEAIIAKLKAVKQGLLSDLLTRGIDANGELRSSQAEAPHLYKPTPLGWIPKDWDAAKFAEVGEVILGRQSAPKYRSGRNMRPYLRVVNVSDDRLDLRDVKAMNFDPSDFSRFRLQYGDVLLTEGDLASAYTVGRSAVYRDEIEGCCFQNTLLRFRPTRPQYSDYFHYAFCHLRATGRFAVATTATTVHHLSAGRLEREVFLPVAPPDEMEGIAQRLAGLEARIDDEADELRKRCEQRAGLVHDLLTGRVRVTPLLAEADQLEAGA